MSLLNGTIIAGPMLEVLFTRYLCTFTQDAPGKGNQFAQQHSFCRSHVLPCMGVHTSERCKTHNTMCLLNCYSTIVSEPNFSVGSCVFHYMNVQYTHMMAGGQQNLTISFNIIQLYKIHSIFIQPCNKHCPRQCLCWPSTLVFYVLFFVISSVFCSANMQHWASRVV